LSIRAFFFLVRLFRYGANRQNAIAVAGGLSALLLYGAHWGRIIP
jgi:hypothetical protein